MALSLKVRRYRSARNPMRRVTAWRTEDNCTLWLSFDDGLEGYVYLGDCVERSILDQLSDGSVFREIALDPFSHALTWRGGIRVDPNALYRHLAIAMDGLLH